MKKLATVIMFVVFLCSCDESYNPHQQAGVNFINAYCDRDIEELKKFSSGFIGRLFASQINRESKGKNPVKRCSAKFVREQKAFEDIILLYFDLSFKLADGKTKDFKGKKVKVENKGGQYWVVTDVN